MYVGHNKTKQRFYNGEVVKFESIDKYKLFPCGLLYFPTEYFLRSIWEHRLQEYKLILKTIQF